MKDIVYLNGKYIPLKKAKISVLDRGFLFGDGVYEVIAVYNGELVGVKPHLDRLDRSLTKISIPLPLDHKQWHDIFTKLLHKNKITDGTYCIYLQVTRGVAPYRCHQFPAKAVTTVFAQVTSSPYALSYEDLSRGTAVITAEDTRWQHCHIKSVALLPNVLFAQQAAEAGSVEVILLRDGYAIEGASSNLFIVKNGVIITPPLSEHILGGITRKIVLQLATKNGIPCKEQPIIEAELKAADEIWITSSSRGIYPITKLDNKKVADGKVGSIWKQMIKLYREHYNK